MIDKPFVSISIICFLLFLSMSGCKGKISESNDHEYNAQYVGKKFIVNEDFFVSKFYNDVIKQNMIDICEGTPRVPTKEQFLRKEITSYSNYKILHVKERGEKFIVTNIQLYTRGPSEGFSFFVIKSLEDKKSYFISKDAYRHGLKYGYIKEIK